MKKGKKKKKGGEAFKVTVKSEDPSAEKAEMQMKKTRRNPKTSKSVGTTK